MLKHLHQFRRWAGVDRAVFFSNAGQILRLLTGPITMLLVLRYLTPEIQGYFYAFAGVVAMQSFLELGFSQNILQFTSHEFAKLRFTAAQTLEGDLVARSRLISLGRLAFGYYAVAALIVLFAIGIGGHIYFTVCQDRFSPDSFKNLPALAGKLAQPAEGVSKFIHDKLSSPTRLALQDYLADPNRSHLKAWQTGLSKDLNEVIQSSSLSTVFQAAGVDLPPAIKQLQTTNPQGNKLVRLNRSLLEAAYPDEILRNTVAWQGAWWIIALAAAFSLMINPAWSLLNGCNQIAITSKFSFWSALACFGVNAAALMAGAGIYASAIGAMFSVLLSAGYLGWYWKNFFIQFLESPQHGRVSWKLEIWPFQWRIATTWMFGYFVFDMISPIAFYFCGPAAAGQLGMSNQLIRQIYNVAMTWIYTKSPRFGMLIAARSWSDLDALWRRSTIQSFLFCLLGLTSFLIAIPLIGYWLPQFPARVAPMGVNIWLAGGMLVQVLITCMSMELRAHKREPYMWLTIVNAVLSVAFILPLVQFWGIYGEAMGFALAILVTFLPAYKIYRLKHLEYRREADALHRPPDFEARTAVGNFL
ncbi:MAG TPA: hypothetical protein VGO57_06945 [Verrucomicrobiae bacterium]|jgi:hypothetical protein